MIEEYPEVSIVFSIIDRISKAAPAVLLICGAVGCVSAPKSEEQRLADSAMVNSVQTALSSDRYLYSRHITVRADSGVVSLGGYVWTPEELTAAAQDTEAVPGVTKVVNRIEVDRGNLMDSSVTR